MNIIDPPQAALDFAKERQGGKLGCGDVRSAFTLWCDRQRIPGHERMDVWEYVLEYVAEYGEDA